MLRIIGVVCFVLWWIGAAFAACPSVTWTNTLKVSCTDPAGVAPCTVAATSNLTKSTNTTAWDAGASSVENFTSGDVTMEFTTSENNTFKMACISQVQTNHNYLAAGTRWCINLESNGTWDVFENGSGTAVWQSSGLGSGYVGVSYVAGDFFRISSAANIVTYYRKAVGGSYVAFFTSANTLSFTPQILVDTSMYTFNGTITQVTFGNTSDCAGNTPTPTQTPTAVWTSTPVATNTPPKTPTRLPSNTPVGGGTPVPRCGEALPQ